MCATAYEPCSQKARLHKQMCLCWSPCARDAKVGSATCFQAAEAHPLRSQHHFRTAPFAERLGWRNRFASVEGVLLLRKPWTSRLSPPQTAHLLQQPRTPIRTVSQESTSRMEHLVSCAVVGADAPPALVALTSSRVFCRAAGDR